MAGGRGGVRDCAGETRGSGRTKPYRGIRRVEGCPSVLRKSKVLIFIEEKGFVRDGKACGERYVSILCPGKDSVFFRPPIFLLELHFPSRSKDTASVLPYGNLPSPPKGRLAGSAAPPTRSPARRFTDSSPPRVPFRPLTTNHCSLSATSLRTPLLSAKIGANRDQRPRGSRRSITNDRGILAPCTM